MDQATAAALAASTGQQPSLLTTSLNQGRSAQPAPAPAATKSRSRKGNAPPPPTPLPPSITRPDMNGIWLLDKSRGNPSLRPYLEAMNVDHLAVEAAEKGESEHDTIQDITLTSDRYRIHKQSRVNDLVLDLELGVAKDEELPMHPAAGTRTRRSYATSDGPRHVRIESTLVTVSGTADVVDVKTLEEETGSDGQPLTVMKQILVVKNRTTGQGHTTTRYFVPYEGEKMEKAATAGGSRRDRGELGPVAAKKRSYKKGGGGGGGPNDMAQPLQVQEPGAGDDEAAVPPSQPTPGAGELVGGHFTRSVGDVNPEEGEEDDDIDMDE